MDVASIISRCSTPRCNDYDVVIAKAASISIKKKAAPTKPKIIIVTTTKAKKPTHSKEKPKS
ncbi:Hypothetical predicted protein, partial [Olea europaea subsp. europaea]